MVLPACRNGEDSPGMERRPTDALGELVEPLRVIEDVPGDRGDLVELPYVPLPFKAL